MTDAPPRAPGSSDPGLSFRPFVMLMAALMAVNALGIDIMLVALPDMGRALHVASENQRQLIIGAYVLGFGFAQLFWGPLADRYGRKPVLVTSLLFYGALCVIGGLAADFRLMLAARLLQGVAAAGSRTLVLSIVRDCYAGRQMARVMSLAIICFLACPILAPSLGQGIMIVAGSWRAIFLALGAFGFGVAGIVAFRLKETLHPEYRRPASFGGVAAAMARVVRDRTSIGYTLCSSVLYGSLMGFISSAQQVFSDIFGAAGLFPIIFAGIAAAMGVAAFVNSRIVERFGTRRLSHTAMFGFFGLSVLHLVIAATHHDTLLSLGLIQACTMFCFGLMGSNFGSMAMEPMGDIAGTASSVQGFLATVFGGVVGIAIGQSFDGTTVPLAAGYTIIGAVVIVAVLWTERGRLFQAHHPQGAPGDAR